jgi:hypothetical protein
MKRRTKCLLGLLALAILLVGLGWRKFRGSFVGAAAGGGAQAAARLSPSNLAQLLASSPVQIGQCDIALLNLLCAEGLPGAEGLNPQDCLSTLDRWTEHVRSETERHLYRYRANPREFESSEGYFRMLMMAVVLYEDFSVRYNPERMSAPGSLDPNDHFSADSRDLFLHGLLSAQVQSLSTLRSAATEDGKSKVQSLNSPSPYPLPEERATTLRPALNPQPLTLNLPLGTCSSMPVLYIAIGRRLGYPLKLVTTKAHLFIRWESAAERFDLEGTGRGMNRYDDEHFKQWPFPVTEEEIQADGYLKSLSPVEELALFLSLRGHCLKEAGRLPEAVVSYTEAIRLVPGSRPYRLLLAAAQEGRGGVPAERHHPQLPLQPLNPQPSALNQPPDPNPLLKLRQQ